MAKKTTVIESGLLGMKDAILKARENGNSRAIGDKDVEALGISSNEFTNWKNYCELLYGDVVKYLDLCDKQEGVSTQQINSALSSVYATWKRVVKNGTGANFDPNFFIRKVDVNRICHMCGEKIQRSAKFNAQLVHRTKEDFRKLLETLIGIRLAGNGMLSDEDRDTITAYEKAERSIRRNSELLDGVKKKDGEEVTGLRTKLERAKYDLSQADAMIAEYGIPAEKAEKFKERFSKAVEDYEKQIATAVSEKDAAKKEEEKLRAAYQALELKLNIVGASLG